MAVLIESFEFTKSVGKAGAYDVAFTDVIEGER